MKFQIRILFLITFCFYYCFPGTTFAQQLITGRVIDQDGDAVVSAIVLSEKSDQGVYPDDKGIFRLWLYPPDTIIVSALGYNLKRVPIRIDDSLFRHSFDILLISKAYELNPVMIQAPRNYEEVKEEIKGLKPFEYQVNGMGAVSSPVTFLYERFSRRAQSERKVAELENEDLRRDALKDLLSQYVSHDIIQLDNVQFDDFLSYCRLTDQFILNSTQYELIVELKKCYLQFIKMRKRN